MTKARHYTLAMVSATPLQLSSVLGGSEPDNQKASIWLSPRASNAAVIYIGGGNATVTSTSYGMRIEIPVTSIPQAPFNPGEFAGGSLELVRSPLRLSHFWALGTTNDFLHIFTIDY